MNRVPNFQQAIVPQAKITRYLLDPTHREGGDKAIYFLSFGFSVAKWEDMASALKTHIASFSISSERKTAYGVNYAVEGMLQTPDGRNPNVRTVWKIEKGKVIPAFVTAYPMS
jgi:hypothetical protein